MAIWIFAALASYLIGAIPFGVIIAKLKGVDLREVGSGNIGATNVIRACGKPLGILVFVLDLLKGFGPVLAVRHLALAGVIIYPPALSKVTDFMVLCGLGATLGHMFPVYLKFKGGKGVATGCGVFFALAPIATAIALGVWAIVVAIWRYISLGSICAAVSLPIIFIIIDEGAFGSKQFITYFCILIALLVIIRHIPNIKRIIKGTESRIGGQKGRRNQL